jgi:hypothetical protein
MYVLFYYAVPAGLDYKPKLFGIKQFVKRKQVKKMGAVGAIDSIYNI